MHFWFTDPDWDGTTTKQLEIHLLSNCIFVSLIGAIFITNLAIYYEKIQFFELTCAVIYIKIESVNEFAVFITAIITERDLKNEYLFRLCSVANNLVMSLEFNPIRCATTLCHFGRTRNGCVGTHFNLLSSTAESRAASGYVIVPKRFDQNEDSASRNEERTRKKASFVPSSGYNRCNM